MEFLLAVEPFKISLYWYNPQENKYFTFNDWQMAMNSSNAHMWWLILYVNLPVSRDNQAAGKTLFLDVSVKCLRKTLALI